ncbi:tyrosine-type recombinase/integrase [Mycobacterium barrassiae]|uniref:tyrosine-type recombinase/integrase n=1 Tax=Mycobacterium barrassiae TaxID=319709 RepID=UPI00226585C9|nr:tyrosine-type recombinase/integrase [Mycobacterium barrassiae]
MSATLRLVENTGDRGGELPPIDAYEVWMRGRGLAVRTISDTVLTLRRLQSASGYPIEATPTLAVSRFLGAEQLGARARYTYFGHLRGFFRWLANEGIGADAMATLPRPRMPRCTPRPITTEQLQALLELPLRRKTRAMVLLAALAGLRAHEIAKVRGQDVDPDARTLYVIGKGGHAATIPLHPLLVEVARAMPARGWWFPANSTRPGEHIGSRHVVNTVSDACKRADIPGGTCHRLRHWYGTNLVASGADLRTAQTLLRHENLASTAIYTEVSDERRVDAIDRLDPFG